MTIAPNHPFEMDTAALQMLCFVGCIVIASIVGLNLHFWATSLSGRMSLASLRKSHRHLAQKNYKVNEDEHLLSEDEWNEGRHS